MKKKKSKKYEAIIAVIVEPKHIPIVGAIFTLLMQTVDSPYEALAVLKTCVAAIERSYDIASSELEHMKMPTEMKQ